jgi:phosphopantothenoylcysteine decarboxylase/phosphopantothenate--cysteine ligase
MSLAGRRVVLGVSGGIASYKACTLARRLADGGATVDVVLTAAAAEFVRPVTFEALTGRPVVTSLWDRDRALAHVHLAHDADLVVVAPATANLIARAAQGVADDVLSALLLARRGPVVLAPAMNDDMYAHPATQANLAVLRQRGWTIVGPVAGPLAEGPSDAPGRMVEPEDLAVHAERALAKGQWASRRVLVTAGPTREPLDAVRVMSNRSSGKMGYALAAAAFARGATVHLIAGPTQLPPPSGVRLTRVETTADLARECGKAIRQADVVLMAAAPADYKAAKRWSGKRPRSGGAAELALEPTTDVLETTRAKRKKGAVIVGFALEADDGVANARAKLTRKRLDLIVLNSAVEAGAGTESDTNRVVLVTKTKATKLPKLPKREVAERILDAVERLL